MDSNTENKDDLTFMKLPSCIPLPLSDEVLKEIVPSAKDYALLSGAGMRYRGRYNSQILEMAPFFLLPSSFPEKHFEYVTNLQPHINLLMHKIAHDYEFLHSCLKNTIKVDDFTARLWNIYETVRKEGITQYYSMGIYRCDYFYCAINKFLKQVEINTIASSFGGLSTIVGALHRYVLSWLQRPELLPKLPQNNALEELCFGMIFSWDYYNSSSSVIMFIVEDVTYNICDQRFHEYEIRKQRPEINVIRRTLTQVSQTSRLTEDKRLFVDNMEVAVVYFRCGYEPAQYPSEAEWEARLDIERSKAVKCPSIYYHLAGAKKVQQEMALPGVLEKYLDPEVTKNVKRLFTGLYSLEKGESGDKAIAMAMHTPENYVLKPQREGGGNNVYDKEIATVLSKIKDTPERDAYILMDRIHPPIQRNYLIRPNEEARLEEVVSELGIFGVIIGSKDKILMNKFAGHMLRTKLSTVNEGGVAAGQGALDSVFLI